MCVGQLQEVNPVPRSAPLPCRHPGCAAIVADGSGYCPKHHNDARQWDNIQRAKARQVRRALPTSSAAWRALRREVLREQPLCVHCLRAGRVRAATVVDHLDGNAMNNERGNLQPLCLSCHAIKTAREDGGFGNPRCR